MGKLKLKYKILKITVGAVCEKQGVVKDRTRGLVNGGIYSNPAVVAGMQAAPRPSTRPCV